MLVKLQLLRTQPITLPQYHTFTAANTTCIKKTTAAAYPLTCAPLDTICIWWNGW